MKHRKTYAFRYEINIVLRNMPIKKAEAILADYEKHLMAVFAWIPSVEVSGEIARGIPLPYGEDYTGDIFQLEYLIVVSKIAHTFEELWGMRQFLEGSATLLKALFDPKDLESYHHHLCNE